MFDINKLQNNQLTKINPDTMEIITGGMNVIDPQKIVNGNIIFNGNSTTTLDYQYYILKRSDEGPITIYAISCIKARQLKPPEIKEDGRRLDWRLQIVFSEELKKDFINNVNDETLRIKGIVKTNFINNENLERYMDEEYANTYYQVTEYNYAFRSEEEANGFCSELPLGHEFEKDGFSTFEEQEIQPYVKIKNIELNRKMFKTMYILRNHTRTLLNDK